MKKAQTPRKQQWPTKKTKANEQHDSRKECKISGRNKHEQVRKLDQTHRNTTNGKTAQTPTHQQAKREAKTNEQSQDSKENKASIKTNMNNTQTNEHNYDKQENNIGTNTTMGN